MSWLNDAKRQEREQARAEEEKEKRTLQKLRNEDARARQLTVKWNQTVRSLLNDYGEAVWGKNYLWSSKYKIETIELKRKHEIGEQPKQARMARILYYENFHDWQIFCKWRVISEDKRDQSRWTEVDLVKIPDDYDVNVMQSTGGFIFFINSRACYLIPLSEIALKKVLKDLFLDKSYGWAIDDQWDFGREMSKFVLPDCEIKSFLTSKW